MVVVVAIVVAVVVLVIVAIAVVVVVVVVVVVGSDCGRGDRDGRHRGPRPHHRRSKVLRTVQGQG